MNHVSMNDLGIPNFEDHPGHFAACHLVDDYLVSKRRRKSSVTDPYRRSMFHLQKECALCGHFHIRSVLMCYPRWEGESVCLSESDTNETLEHTLSQPPTPAGAGQPAPVLFSAPQPAPVAQPAAEPAVQVAPVVKDGMSRAFVEAKSSLEAREDALPSRSIQPDRAAAQQEPALQVAPVVKDGMSRAYSEAQTAAQQAGRSEMQAVRPFPLPMTLPPPAPSSASSALSGGDRNESLDGSIEISPGPSHFLLAAWCRGCPALQFKNSVGCPAGCPVSTVSS